MLTACVGELQFIGIFVMVPNISSAKSGMLTSHDFMKTPDNSAVRYGIWYCQKERRRGSILLLNGRREFMEKYTETIGELIERGFDVYSLDWRGKGFSTRMLADRHKGFIEDFDVYLNDLKMFVSNIVMPKAIDPLIILAHSMGGHIALRFIHDYPGIADRIVLTAPMVDIFMSSLTRWFARFISRAANKTGFNRAYVFGSGGDTDEKFKGNNLTSDPVRFMATAQTIAENPDLAIGGVTYGWLSAALKSIGILRKPGFAEQISTPILLISAGEDRIVSIKAQKKICSLLPNCSYIEIPGARHEILRETDAVRSIFWEEFDRFIRSDISKIKKGSKLEAAT
jgi:lysophospholipase